MKIQYLIETANFKSLITEIKRHCSDYINEIENVGIEKTLKRGMQQPIDGKIEIRQDRRSLHSHPVQTNIFNLAFETLYGQKEIRSKTLFCSPDEVVARNYGHAHVVFPINATSMYCISGVKDSILVMSKMVNEFELEMRRLSGEMKFMGRELLYDIKTLNDVKSLDDRYRTYFKKCLTDAMHAAKFTNMQNTNTINLSEVSVGTEVGLYNAPYAYGISLSTLYSIAKDVMDIESQPNMNEVLEYVFDEFLW